VWKEYSQPWSALPRASHGRLVIFIEAGAAAAEDIVRRADDLVDVKDKALRKVLEKARVTASSATSAVRVFVVKNELVGCCSLGVSVIKALYTIATKW
jgi:hypothetical protein